MIAEIEKTIPKFLLKYLKHCIFTEVISHPNHKTTLRKWVSQVLYPLVVLQLPFVIVVCVQFVNYFVDNVSAEEAGEETEETDEEMRKAKDDTDTLMERYVTMSVCLVHRRVCVRG